MIYRSQLCEKYENYMTFLVPPTLQAVAYGLPVVATKNGGPVDILKVYYKSFVRYFYISFATSFRFSDK